MSILTGPAIVAAVRDGTIEVDPWDEALVNPLVGEGVERAG